MPDAALARRALENVARSSCSRSSSAISSRSPSRSCRRPSIEKRDGHLTDWEGRSQRVRPLSGTRRARRPDWEIFAGLAVAAGGDLGFETLEELRAEMARLCAPGSGRAAAGAGGAGASRGLRLVTYPLLIDEGRLSAAPPTLKAALEDAPFVEVHPRRRRCDRARRRRRRGRPHGGGRGRRSRFASRRTSPRARCSSRGTSPGLAANTLLVGLVDDRGDPRAGRTRSSRPNPSRRSPIGDVAS